MAAEYTRRIEPRTGEKTVQGLVVGRDKTVVDPAEVYKLAVIGCKDREIADWFGIKEDTLRYNFTEYLLKGREEMKQTLRRTMLDIAVNGKNTVMCIFLAKNWLGMSDQGQADDSLRVLPWSDDDVTDQAVIDHDYKDSRAT